jgi:hypothetical protein
LTLNLQPNVNFPDFQILSSGIEVKKFNLDATSKDGKRMN